MLVSFHTTHMWLHFYHCIYWSKYCQYISFSRVTSRLDELKNMFYFASYSSSVNEIFVSPTLVNVYTIFIFQEKSLVMLRYAEKKCKIKKPARPMFFPFLLDGLGSREVFCCCKNGMGLYGFKRMGELSHTIVSHRATPNPGFSTMIFFILQRLADLKYSRFKNTSTFQKYMHVLILTFISTWYKTYDVIVGVL